MILHKKLKLKLNQNHNTKQAKEILTKAMGYENTKKGLVTLGEFIEAGSIEAWLGKGQYDFRYGNEEFVIALAKVLEVDVSKEIREAHRRIGLMSQYVTTSLHVVVNFERKGESVFMLMGYNKYLVVDYDTQTLVGLNDDAAFLQIQSYAQAHYQKYQGTLPLWGKIEGYTYKHIDGVEYGILTH